MDTALPPEPKNSPPELYVWKDKLEAKTKHLDLIQAVIIRMANNSFMIKGWCITLVSALLAFAIGKDGSPWLIVVSFLPVLMFWYLDSYFLQQERLFRRVYDRQLKTEDTTFQITPPKDLIATLETVGSVMRSNTLMTFYGGILTIVLVATALLWWRASANPKSSEATVNVCCAATVAKPPASPASSPVNNKTLSPSPSP